MKYFQRSTEEIESKTKIQRIKKMEKEKIRNETRCRVGNEFLESRTKNSKVKIVKTLV